MIGYGGRKRLSDFFTAVDSISADLIVDVREDPSHAYRGTYTKPYLKKRFASKYVWIPELGNKTRDINNIQLVDEEKGLRRLLELARTYDHIILLCAEKKDEDCHRSYVRDRLLRLLQNESQHLRSNP
jgi:uncharacterized protein (DUF488 family)